MRRKGHAKEKEVREKKKETVKEEDPLGEGL